MMITDKKRVCLLLSATITPLNVPLLKRADPQQRENDYLKSLRYWVAHPFPIVFIDNSNTYSEKIKELLEKSANSEYLSFESKFSYLGKSHGEVEIIEYALKNSFIIEQSDIIIKVTGRYYVKNIAELLKNFLLNNCFVLGWMKFNFEFADSRLMIGSKNFFEKYFIPESHIIDESKGIYFEHIYARAIHRAIADGKKWCLPNIVPVFHGISGTENIKYNNSFLRCLKRNIILYLTRVLIKIPY